MTELKRCSRGENCVHEMGCWQPANNNFFGKDKNKEDNFAVTCKACRKAYYKQNRSKVIARVKKYRIKNREAINQQKRLYRQENKQTISQKKREEYQRNRRRYLDYRKKYYQENKDKVNQQSNEYRKKNRNKIKRLNRNYRQNNKDTIRAKRGVRKSRRIANELSLPNTLTNQQWQRCLSYFNHKCIACGTPQSEPIPLQIEHWQPVSNPQSLGNVAENVVPMCSNPHGYPEHTGCNQSKGAKNAYEWLVYRFGEAEADKIYKRVMDYFDWVREQDADSE